MIFALLIFIGSLVWIAWELVKISKARDEFVPIRKELTIKKVLGWGLLTFGATHIVLPELKFLMGVLAIPVALISMAAGGVFLITYYRPKIAESLAVAERTNGILTLMVLMRRLELSRKLAIRTLRKLEEDGLALVLNPDPQDPKSQKIADIIFLVRGFSGRMPGATQSAAPQGTQPTDDQVREQHSHVTDLGVDEVNRMILEGTLDVGRSGRQL